MSASVLCDFGLKTLSGIIIGWPAAYFAARWAINKFHVEKRWERKEKAYIEIINAMHDMKMYSSIQKENYGQGVGYSDEKMNDLYEKYQQSFWILDKAREIGSLYISRDVFTALDKLSKRKHPDPQDGPIWDHYEEEFVLCSKALEEVKAIAKMELALK